MLQLGGGVFPHTVPQLLAAGAGCYQLCSVSTADAYIALQMYTDAIVTTRLMT
jgi:hypothetical protein